VGPHDVGGSCVIARVLVKDVGVGERPSFVEHAGSGYGLDAVVTWLGLPDTYRVGFRVRIHLEEIMNLAGFHLG
jgi:hypothetical protein